VTTERVCKCDSNDIVRARSILVIISVMINVNMSLTARGLFQDSNTACTLMRSCSHGSSGTAAMARNSVTTDCSSDAVSSESNLQPDGDGIGGVRVVGKCRRGEMNGVMKK
jgi:hypothetical protein